MHSFKLHLDAILCFNLSNENYDMTTGNINGHVACKSAGSSTSVLHLLFMFVRFFTETFWSFVSELY